MFCERKTETEHRLEKDVVRFVLPLIFGHHYKHDFLNLDGSKYVVSLAEDLTFDPMRKEDAGDYECTADNGIGPGLSKKITVSVTGDMFSFSNFALLEPF